MSAAGVIIGVAENDKSADQRPSDGPPFLPTSDIPADLSARGALTG